MAHNSLPWAHSAKDKVMFPELEGWEDYTYGMANQAELKKRINKANSVSTFPAFKSIAEEQGMSATALIAMERKAAESPDTQLIYNGFQINGGHWEQLDDLNEFRASNNYPELSMDQYTGALLRGAHTDINVPFRIKGSHPELSMYENPDIKELSPNMYGKGSFAKDLNWRLSEIRHDPESGYTDVWEGAPKWWRGSFSPQPIDEDNPASTGYWKNMYAEKYEKAGYEVEYPQTHAKDMTFKSGGGIYFPADVNTEGDIYDNVVALIEHEKNGLWTAPEELFQQGSGGRQARGPYKNLINQEIAKVELPDDYVHLDEAMHIDELVSQGSGTHKARKYKNLIDESLFNQGSGTHKARDDLIDDGLFDQGSGTHKARDNLIDESLFEQHGGGSQGSNKGQKHAQAIEARLKAEKDTVSKGPISHGNLSEADEKIFTNAQAQRLLDDEKKTVGDPDHVINHGQISGDDKMLFDNAKKIRADEAKKAAEKAEFESKIREGIKKAEENRIKQKLEEERLDKEWEALSNQGSGGRQARGPWKVKDSGSGTHKARGGDGIDDSLFNQGSGGRKARGGDGIDEGLFNQGSGGRQARGDSGDIDESLFNQGSGGRKGRGAFRDKMNEYQNSLNASTQAEANDAQGKANQSYGVSNDGSDAGRSTEGAGGQTSTKGGGGQSYLESLGRDGTSLSGTDPFRFSTFAYPLDVTTDMTNGHYMLFYVNVQNKTKYSYAGYNDEGYLHLVGDEYETSETKLTGPPSSGQSAADYKTTYYRNKGASEIYNTDIAYRKGVHASGVPGNHLLANQVTLMKQRPATQGLAAQLNLTTRITDSVAIYLPANVEDSTNAGYQDFKTGMAGFLALSGGDVLNKIKNHDFEGAASEFIGMGGTILWEMLKKTGVGAVSAFTGADGVQESFDKAFGQTLNPYIEVAFNNMGVREFDYTFHFRPKSAEETEEVKNIINLFRFHMVPELKGTNHRYMTLPSTFDIHYMYQTSPETSAENGFYSKIATCVLKSCNVNYTPDGVKSFESGAPTQISMRLSFMETEMLTKQKVAQGF